MRRKAELTVTLEMIDMAFTPTVRFETAASPETAYEKAKVAGFAPDLKFNDRCVRKVSDTYTPAAEDKAYMSMAHTGYGLKFDASCIDCGEVDHTGEHMYAFYGYTNTF